MAVDGIQPIEASGVIPTIAPPEDVPAEEPAAEEPPDDVSSGNNVSVEA